MKINPIMHDLQLIKLSKQYNNNCNIKIKTFLRVELELSHGVVS